MKIHYLTPYSIEKNIGKAYNEACELVPDGDWICLRDGDTMFLTPEWGQHIQQIAEVAIQSNYALVGCMTNRLATNSRQIIGEYDNHDIKYHHMGAINRRELYGNEIIDFQHVLAAHFLLFPRSTWDKVKFAEKTVHFDTLFSNSVAKWGKLGLATGLYIYHMYRIWSDQRQPQYDYQHLIN